MPIQFNMNTQKAIESVLWIIRRGESNMYNIWKILFSAEKYHLNTYGRPITGDKYMAMEYGTVPGWLYETAKLERQGMGFFKHGNTLIAEREPMPEYFSISDFEALQHGFDEYAGLNFGEVLKKNHEEPAWKKNHAMYGCTPIPFEDFVDEEWLKEDLASLGYNMCL
ncbi:hypothetical protein R80B4_01063 [Fibrobacteres bacterium R8-0-B4]